MAVRVGVGIGRFPFDEVSSFRAWLAECEESAIDSLWQSDQVITTQPYPEPVALLSMIAGATRRLKIGMNAVVIGFRDPVTFARQCGALDFLSEGRFLPVIGVGAEKSPSWRATGRSPRGRGAKANEALEIMTRLWREEGVSFEGEHYRIDQATISPRPVQDPLPLWIGGSSPAAIRRTLRFGSGWLAGLQTAEEAVQTAEAIRLEAELQQVAIPDDHYGATILYRLGREASASSAANEVGRGMDKRVRGRVEQLLVSGSAEAVLERIRIYVAGGITKFVAVPASNSEAEFVEQTRLLARDVIPEAMKLAV